MPHKEYRGRGGTNIIERDQRLRPASIVIADGVEYAMSPQGGQQLLNEERQQRGTDGGKKQVVDHKEARKLQRFLVAHELSSAQDDDIVRNYQTGRFPKGGERRLARNEAKVFRRMADDGGVELVEKGPEMHSKRPVKSGQRGGREFGEISSSGHYDGISRGPAASFSGETSIQRGAGRGKGRPSNEFLK